MTTLTTGNDCIAIGYNALASNTTASYNVAVGSYSLDHNTTGADNTAMGFYALSAITTSGSSTAIGTEALKVCTGAKNTAVGQGAGINAAGNIENTFIGAQAGKDVTNAGYMACLGFRAGQTSTTGGFGCFMGAYASPNSSSSQAEIVIGYAATGKGTNTGFISPNGGAVYQGNNSSTWSTTSDIRIKKNVVDNTTGLDKINQIRVRNFEYRTVDEIVDFENAEAAMVKKEGLQLGVIAQEIEEILPDVVETHEETGVKSVNPDNMTWYLVNAIKELTARVQELESKSD